MDVSTGIVKKSSTPRLIELDILRGFLLLWMTFTHLPTKISVFSNQTFGFVSGAEGFIFLAGFMIGQLEYRKEQRGGWMETIRDVVKRTARVYAYHVGLLIIAFTFFAGIAVHFHRLSLLNLLSFYLAHAKTAVAASLLLVYRPSLLDILPMYVIFLLLTPLARSMARRWGWDPVVYVSLAVWAFAQFKLCEWLYRNIELLGFGVPENSTGAFDMYAWQLLWVVGLALGSIYAEKRTDNGSPLSGRGQSERAIPRWLTVLSAIVATVFLCLRYVPLDRWMNADSYGWLIDKWHLGPVRVINFAAISIVLVRFGPRLAALRIVQPLALLGRASIEVFSVHVLCCLAGDAMSAQADPDLAPWQQLLLLGATLLALFTTALWFGKPAQAMNKVATA